MGGDVVRYQVDLLVSMFFADISACGLSYANFAVCDFKFVDREIRSGARTGRGLGLCFRALSSVAQAGIIPFSRTVLQQQDVRILDCERTYLELPRKYQRHPLHSDLESGCLEKWAFAERRIIADGNIVRFSAPTENGRRDFANMHLAAKCLSEFFLYIRTEAVYIDKQRNQQNGNNEDANNNSSNNQKPLHAQNASSKCTATEANAKNY